MRLFRSKKMITIPMNNLKRTEQADLSFTENDNTKNRPVPKNLK
ncbi:MAG: hypothetical protein ACOX3Q_06990 [Clostridia bacterium]|jgi:hypothetical protein